MGDYQGIIPASENVKTAGDVTAVGTAFASLFKWIPWPELAACAAFFWTLIRIAETDTVRSIGRRVRKLFRRK